MTNPAKGFMKETVSYQGEILSEYDIMEHIDVLLKENQDDFPGGSAQDETK